MMFLAGLQAIPAEQYEAAAIDGAGVVQRFQYVLLPGLASPIVITVLLSTIWTGAFDAAYTKFRDPVGDSR